MPYGLYYENSTFKIPHEVVMIRAKQLKTGMTQFLNLPSPYSCGLYIIYRWAFTQSKEPKVAGHIYFKVELLNISTGDRVFRVWEMKDNHLLADNKLENPFPFTNCGYVYADWSQELTQKGLSRKDNISLDQVLTMLESDNEVSYKMVVVSEGSCKLQRDQNDEIWLEYRIWVDFITHADRVITYRCRARLSKDLDCCEILEKDFAPAHEDKPETIELSTQEEEEIVLFARDYLVNVNLIESGDCIVDHYYIRLIERLDTQTYKFTIDLLMINQKGRTSLMSVIMMRKFNINEVVKAKKLVYSSKTMEYILKKGSQMQSWQRFSYSEATLQNPGINRAVHSWKKNSDGRHDVLGILKAEARVKRDKNNLFIGFDMKLLVRLRALTGEVQTQEWRVSGNPLDDKDYKMSSSKVKDESEGSKTVDSQRLPPIEGNMHSAFKGTLEGKSHSIDDHDHDHHSEMKSIFYGGIHNEGLKRDNRTLNAKSTITSSISGTSPLVTPKKPFYRGREQFVSSISPDLTYQIFSTIISTSTKKKKKRNLNRSIESRESSVKGGKKRTGSMELSPRKYNGLVDSYMKFHEKTHFVFASNRK